MTIRYNRTAGLYAVTVNGQPKMFPTLADAAKFIGALK